MNIDITKQQIGIGNLMAVGAREFTYDSMGNSLSFRVGPNSRTLIEKIAVTLDPMDVYVVRYFVMDKRTNKIVVDEVMTGVYCDNLGSIVRKMGDR